MFAVIAALIGAILGWRNAKRANGNRLDQAQYAAVYAIIFFLLGLLGTIALDWAGIF